MTINQYAVVENGVVSNVVLWDGNEETWSPPVGSTVNLIPEGIEAGIGYTFNGTNYAAPVGS